MAPHAAAMYARILRPRWHGAGGDPSDRGCRAFAQRRKWQVADLYVDDDVSAYSGMRRPEYTRMLEELGAGLVGG